MRRLMIKIAEAVKKFFYIFLDISGILLGLFLIWLGFWMVLGRDIPQWLGGVVLFLGICAFLIHVGHYYSWKLARWIFGKNDYFLTRKKEEETETRG